MFEPTNVLQGDLESDALFQVQEDVAEVLARLSEATDTPSHFSQTTSQFLPTDVDFESDGWTRRLIEVQGWLHLDDALPLAGNAELIAGLARLLGMRDGQFHSVDKFGTLRPETSVLERLRERAEKASQLQRLFLDTFYGPGGTREAASVAWSDAWEDDDEAEADQQPPTPVSAKAATWRINEFVAAAGAGRLNLNPTYQRGDVWITGARQMLIESILRGIPLPSVILLKPSTGGPQPFEVVDGKQRLTSILRFIGRHPLAIERVVAADKAQPGNNLMVLFAEDYPKFKRAWKALFGEAITSSVEEQYFFPFKLRNDERGLSGSDLAPLRGKYYSQIKQLQIKVADDPVSVADVFEGYSEYLIPIIIYNRATQRQIHEVFNLYNKQGTHLNAEEIRNAIFNDLEITRATALAAGDADPRSEVQVVAPSLEKDWARTAELQNTLSAYGFGESRYRRTKVLLWIIATLLGTKPGENLPSTAKHIDNLLYRVQAAPNDPLRNKEVLTDLFSWIASSIEIHAGHTELWSPEFMDGGNGAKWQELQLVGTVIGIALAAIDQAEGLDAKLDDSAELIYAASRSASWRRPDKTQTKTQWAYIAHVALDIARILDVDLGRTANIMGTTYGSSGVTALTSVAGEHVG